MKSKKRPNRKIGGKKSTSSKKQVEKDSNNLKNAPELDENFPLPSMDDKVLSPEELEEQLSSIKGWNRVQKQEKSRLASPIGYSRKHGGLPATKKSLGQNWLKDNIAAENIVKALDPFKGEHVLEVGPGGGALTEPLLNAGAKVTSVEIDQRMIEVLEHKFGDNPNFRLVHADILQSDMNEIMEGNQFSLVGNLPYHITSSLLFGIMDSARLTPGKIRRIVVMIQLEVARRIAAKPGDSDYSILSVFMNMWGKPEIALEVDRFKFFPPPKVHAGVIKMDIAEQSLYPLPHWPTFKRLVKGTFGKRRKMLSNSLPGVAKIGDWRALEFDWTRRPQTLSTEEFAWLAERLIPKKSKDEE